MVLKYGKWLPNSYRLYIQTDPQIVQKAGKGFQLAALRRNKVIKSKDDQTLPGIGLTYKTDRQTHPFEFLHGMKLGTDP